MRGLAITPTNWGIIWCNQQREFLSVRELQFLNSIRISYVRHDDLTPQQVKDIGVIGKRLGLVE